jgi:hypothetical protein
MKHKTKDEINQDWFDDNQNILWTFLVDQCQMFQVKSLSTCDKIRQLMDDELSK